MSNLYFNEEGHYSEGNTCDNEVICSLVLHYRKKLNILTPQMPVYSIRIENLGWYKYQRQPLGVFFQKMLPLKFCKIYWKQLCQSKHM